MKRFIKEYWMLLLGAACVTAAAVFAGVTR